MAVWFTKELLNIAIHSVGGIFIVFFDQINQAYEHSIQEIEKWI